MPTNEQACYLELTNFFFFFLSCLISEHPFPLHMCPGRNVEGHTLLITGGMA